MFFIIPFRTLFVSHLLFVEIFMWSKIIVSMTIIYVLIMLIHKDIHLLRLYDIFFKDNISRMIIPHASLALFIIIHKIHSLSTIVRYSLFWLVFNKWTAQLSIVRVFAIDYCLCFVFFFIVLKAIGAIKSRLGWAAIDDWFFHDIFDGNLLGLVSFKIG